jgi:hypothetical protein
MKKLLLILTVIVISLTSSTTGEDIILMSGSLDFFNQAKSVYIEFDMSKTSIDALSSETAFVDYRIKKEKEDKNGKPETEVRANWEKDKKYIINNYLIVINKLLDDYPVAFNNDNLKSDYKMVIIPSHWETGNPIKYSSVKYKLIVTEVATGASVAVVNVPTFNGDQMGPMTPTVGMRIALANTYSILGLKKFLKKSFK